MATDAQRRHLHGLMRLLIAHEPKVHYAQRRPMEAVTLNEKQLRARLLTGAGIRMDCSESVTALCRWAGLADPNGLRYNRTGYTGTLLANPKLKHYTDPRRALTGALVVFGPPTGDHVCMVLEPDPDHGDPLLFSHGQERGPLAIRLSDERRYQRRPVTFLEITNL